VTWREGFETVKGERLSYGSELMLRISGVGNVQLPRRALSFGIVTIHQGVVVCEVPCHFAKPAVEPLPHFEAD
jgi:hypothetical protein